MQGYRNRVEINDKQGENGMAGRRIKMSAVCGLILAAGLAGLMFPLRGVREEENRVKNENHFDIGRAEAGTDVYKRQM